MWRRKVTRSSLSTWSGYEASLVPRPHPHNGMRQGSNGVLYAMSTLLESCTRIHCSLDKVDCRNVVSSWYTTHMHTQSISICVCTPNTWISILITERKRDLVTIRHPARLYRGVTKYHSPLSYVVCVQGILKSMPTVFECLTCSLLSQCGINY